MFFQMLFHILISDVNMFYCFLFLRRCFFTTVAAAAVSSSYDDHEERQ